MNKGTGERNHRENGLAQVVKMARQRLAEGVSSKRYFGMTRGQVLQRNVDDGHFEKRKCWFSIETDDTGTKLALRPLLPDNLYSYTGPTIPNKSFWDLLENEDCAFGRKTVKFISDVDTPPILDYKRILKNQLISYVAELNYYPAAPTRVMVEDSGAIVLSGDGKNSGLFTMPGCIKQYNNKRGSLVNQYDGRSIWTRSTHEEFLRQTIKDTSCIESLMPMMWVNGRKCQYLLNFATEWKESQYGDMSVFTVVGSFIISYKLLGDKLFLTTRLRDPDDVFKTIN